MKGNGKQPRDFTFIDVVSASLLACKAKDVGGMLFNIGTGERHILNDLLRSLFAILGRELDAEHGKPRAGDERYSQADIGGARKHLGYMPEVGFAA